MYLNSSRGANDRRRRMNAPARTPSTGCVGSDVREDPAAVSSAASLCRQQQLLQEEGTESQRASSLNWLANGKDASNADLDATTLARLPGRDGARSGHKVTFREQERPQQQTERSPSARNPIRRKGTGLSSFMPGRGERYRTRANASPRSNGKTGFRGGGGGGSNPDARRSTSVPTRVGRKLSGDVLPPSPPRRTTKNEAAAQPAKGRNDSRYGTAYVAREKPRKVAPWKSMFLCCGGCGGGGRVVDFGAGVGPAAGRYGDGETASTNGPLTAGGAKITVSGRREHPLPPPGQPVARPGHDQQVASAGSGGMDSRTEEDSGDSERTGGAAADRDDASLEVSPSEVQPSTHLGSSGAPTVEGSTSSAEEEIKHGGGGGGGDGGGPRDETGDGGASGDNGRRAASPTAADLSALEQTTLHANRLSNALWGLENRRRRGGGGGGGGGGRRHHRGSGDGDGKMPGVEDEDDEDDNLETAPSFPPPRFASFPGLSPAASFASTATLAAALAATSPWTSPSSSFAGAPASRAASRERDEAEHRRHTIDAVEVPEAASTGALWEEQTDSPDSAAASTFEKFRSSPLPARRSVSAASPLAVRFAKGTRETEEEEEEGEEEEKNAHRINRGARGEPRHGGTAPAAANRAVVVRRAPRSGAATMRRKTDTGRTSDGIAATTPRGRRTRFLSASGGGGWGGERVHDQQQQRGRPSARVGPRPARKPAPVPTQAPHAATESYPPRPATNAEGVAAGAARSMVARNRTGALERARELLSSLGDPGVEERSDSRCSGSVCRQEREPLTLPAPRAAPKTTTEAGAVAAGEAEPFSEEAPSTPTGVDISKQESGATALPPPPRVWVAQHVDGKKHGPAFLLSDGSVVMCFRDGTTMVSRAPLASAGDVEFGGALEYHAEEGAAERPPPLPTSTEFTLRNVPPLLEKKTKRLVLVRKRLQDLERDAAEERARDGVKGGSAGSGEEEGAGVRGAPASVASSGPSVLVEAYRRTRRGCLFVLSDSTVQARFSDKTEILLSGDTGVVALVRADGRMRETLLLAEAVKSQRTDITKRIRYCGTMIERLHQGVVSGGVGEGRGASTATNANKSLSYSSQNNDDGSKTKGRRTSRRRMKEVGA